MGFSSFKSGRQDLNLRPDDPETSAWLCRSLLAALLFQKAVVNEGRLVVTLGTAEPSDILSAETSDHLPSPTSLTPDPGYREDRRLSPCCNGWVV